jgi:putative colanic acid biosynthesis glycosyltransferase WcaI
VAHVLIYSLVFPPDGVSTGQIMGELAVDLARLGHRVAVVTTQPHYNRDERALAAQPLEPFWRGLLFRSSFHGMPVIHTRMPQKAAGIRARLSGWLGFHVLGFVATLRFCHRSQVIIVPSPLLSAGIVGWLVGLVTGAKYVYNVQELYPDLGIQLGKLRNPVVIGLLRTMERFVYRTAAAITVITHGMHHKLLARGVPARKVHYVPNFVDVNELLPLPKSNPFSQEYGLTQRFVVTYAGNMGYAQGLEVLLDAANELQQESDIVLALVGSGVAREALMAQVERHELRNVKFVEHQPYARVPEIYAASDLCVVPLLDSIGADAIPSKVYRIMACARPVLAIASPASELADVIRQSGAGVVVPPNASAIAEAIRQYARLGAERRQREGDAGRSYVLTHVSRGSITKQYDELVTAIAQPSP